MKSLVLEGTPLEIGRKHGEHFRKQIHEISAIRRELLRGYLKELRLEEIEELCSKQLRFFSRAKVFGELYEEFLGIAEGAHLGLHDLVILNNYTDMRDFGIQRSASNKACSLVGIKNERGVFCGQTWDMHASAQPYVVHLDIRKRIRHHVFSIVGCLGLSGVSSRSVSVMINNLSTHRTRIGILWPALVRGMLDQSTAQKAQAFLKKNLPCSGHNYCLADPKGILNIETTGRESETTHTIKKPGFVFHTNHYVGKLKKYEARLLASSTSHARYRALESYFSQHPAQNLNFEDLSEKILHQNGVSTVCIAPGDQPHASATCGGIFMDLQARAGFTHEGIWSYSSRGSEVTFTW